MRFGVLTTHGAAPHAPNMARNIRAQYPAMIDAPVNAAGDSESARCEHGPFAARFRETEPLAQANPFRFSTQYQNDGTDLPCYGYRYDHVSMGRWPNRNSIGEQGGINLHGFVGNSPLNGVGPFGLLEVETTPEGFEVPAWGVTQNSRLLWACDGASRDSDRTASGGNGAIINGGNRI